MENEEEQQGKEYSRPIVKVEETGDITVIRLVRPDKFNALDLSMIRDLSQAIAQANQNLHTRCVVVKGASGNFCSGRDLGNADELQRLGPVLEYDEAYTSIFENLAALTKPSVAIVQGYAVAGGFTLAIACDFVIAQANAQFGALEMKHGFPAAINTAVLAHCASPRFALELLLSKQTVSAKRLAEMGLVNRVAEDEDELTEISDEFIAALAALDPIAVKLTKETHRAARNMPYRDALIMAKQLNALLMTSGKIPGSRNGRTG
jgi:enoyl-CoA hydratase/carnithine racemase